MPSLRENLNKKGLGWVVAGLILLVAVGIQVYRSFASDPNDPAFYQENVTIRFTDTGKEVTMRRGRFEKELRLQDGLLDPAKGIRNPETGEFSGILVSKTEWQQTVERINAEKRIASERAAKGVAPGGAAARSAGGGGGATSSGDR
ncbi:MAG: hypothetical protein SFZ23_01520 [Planctomycetota bacterium]|nr:hypothetical protein [Planctomycetota bacterium]